MQDASLEQLAQIISLSIAETLKVTNVKNPADHDLLIRLDENIKGLSRDITELNTGTTKRITDLENGKVEQCEFNELKNDIYISREKRMRSLENKTANFWIAFSIYSVALAGMITMFLNHISKV